MRGKGRETKEEKTWIKDEFSAENGRHHVTAGLVLVSEQRRRWLKKVRAGSCKFPTGQIMGNQNFHCAPKLHKIADFQPQILYF